MNLASLPGPLLSVGSTNLNFPPYYLQIQTSDKYSISEIFSKRLQHHDSVTLCTSQCSHIDSKMERYTKWIILFYKYGWRWLKWSLVFDYRFSLDHWSYKHTCPQPVTGLVSRLVFMGSIPVLHTNLWFQKHLKLTSG